MTRPLVAIRSVSKNFGEFQALKEVSLDVWAGEDSRADLHDTFTVIQP